jgi:hypothetical protein
MSHEFTELPDDQFGVFVDGDMDRLRLLWLVNQIGEEKLRRAVASLKMKYPDSLPFVSTLLKRFGKKVPTHVYAPKNIPVYRVYVYVLADRSKFKIGFSGTWTNRIFGLPNDPDTALDLFDLDASFSVLIGSRKSDAIKLEQHVLAVLRSRAYQTSVPSECERFFASGKTEWFLGFAIRDLNELLCIDENGNRRSVMSLRQAFEYDLSGSAISETKH